VGGIPKALKRSCGSLSGYKPALHRLSLNGGLATTKSKVFSEAPQETKKIRPLRDLAGSRIFIGNCGERGRNRTSNLLIKSQLLCQLSYAPLRDLQGWDNS
jgi:hypothetical protein